MWKNVVLFVCLCALIGDSLGVNSDFQAKLKQGVKEYVRTGKKNKAYRDVVDNISLKHMFRNNYRPYIEKSIVCDLCDTIVGDLMVDRLNGTDAQTITDYVVNFCVNMNIERETICRGVISSNVDIVLYIVDNKPELTSKHICSIVLQSSGCETDTPFTWSLDIPEATGTAPDPDLSSLPPLKIAHLTDIHYDPSYEAGALAACDDPLCCQNDLPKPTDPADGAGFWGDYRSCDTPWVAVQDAIQRVKIAHPDLEYVYYTGDIISHKVWATSIQNNTLELKKTLQELSNNFDIPVFPVMGNHEPHPLNVWVDTPDPLITMQWVFDIAAEEWPLLIQDSSTADTIRQGGYYTTLVKPGLRVIGLNGNVCYTYNWWLLFDQVDPFGQLQWLIDTLVQAELAGERVHILTHIPTGHGSCLKNWAKQFRLIVERFSGTIAAIFNGHTHNDEFVLYYPSDNLAEAVAVAFNGGSVTTYSDLNPSYKVYEADAESFEILDYEQYIYNLTEANQAENPETTPPVWYKEYSFKAAYGMERIRAQDLSRLVTRMATNQTLLDQYYSYYVKEGDTSMAAGCDSSCHLERLCSIVENEFGDSAKCDEISGLFNPQ